MYGSRRVLLGAALPSLLVALGGCGSDDVSSVTTSVDAGLDAAQVPDATTSNPAPGDAGVDLDSMTAATGDSATTGGDAGDAGDAGEGGAAGGPITVTGKVVFLHQGVAGATVVIDGQSAMTSATGTFTLAHVSVPYDLSVIVPARNPAQQTAVRHFVGLQGESPVLAVTANVTPNTASVTGTVSGGAPVPNATHTGFSLVATSAKDFSLQRFTAPGTAANKDFDETLSWSTDDASTQVFLYALQTTPDTGIPTAYGYAGTYTVPTPVTNGATASNDIVPLLPTTDSAVSGTIVLPAGYTLAARHLVIETMNDGAFDFGDTSPSSTFAFATPSAPFITSTNVFFVASGPAGESSTADVPLSPGTTGNIVTVSTPPALQAPTAQQTGVDLATLFSWAPVAGTHCLYDVRIFSGIGGNTEFDLVTTATSVAIPDLSAFGAGLAPATTYHWLVTCELTPGAVSVDDATTSSGLTSVGSDSTATSAFTSK
jgi:hypothetical protein